MSAQCGISAQKAGAARLGLFERYLTQVALNDTIMVFVFAPIVGLLLGLSAITVPWDTLFLSVVLYIVIPVVFAHLWRKWLLGKGGDAVLQKVLQRFQPLSLVALLAVQVLVVVPIASPADALVGHGST